MSNFHRLAQIVAVLNLFAALYFMTTRTTEVRTSVGLRHVADTKRLRTVIRASSL